MTAPDLLAAAVAHQGAGRAAEAAAAYVAAIAAGARGAEVHNNLGIARRDAGDRAGAEAALRDALRLRPGYARAATNLADLLDQAGRPTDALDVLDAAIAAGAATLRTRAGFGWVAQLRPDRALPHLEAALAAEPADAGLRNEYAGALMALGRPGAAAEHFAQVVAARPDRPDLRVNLGVALHQAGRSEEAAAAHRETLRRDPACRAAWHNLMLVENYLPGLTALDQARTARGYAQAFPGAAAPVFANTRDPDRRLRIGLLSADLRAHPVGFFLRGPLAALDRVQVEVFAYANQTAADDLTRRLRSLCDGWRAVKALDDAAVAAAIRADGIDILVDLGGHTAGTRLPVLEHRPAPVQASWIGYANTTGSPAVDWILADAVTIPPGEEALFTERVMRLPGCYLCFAPDVAVPRRPLPMLGRGHAVLGCFQAPTKLHDGVFAAWARILSALPNARLLLKARQYNEPETAAAVRARFAVAGGDAARLVLEGQSGYAAYLARYGDVDFMLDSFPFPGATTTVEALAAGVPTLTLRGRGGMMSRNGETLLTAAGIPDWIAADIEDYVAQAVRRARDPGALAELRGRLGLDVLADGADMARRLQAAFRAMWREWCARG